MSDLTIEEGQACLATLNKLVACVDRITADISFCLRQVQEAGKEVFLSGGDVRTFEADLKTALKLLRETDNALTLRAMNYSRLVIEGQTSAEDGGQNARPD